MSTNRRMDEPKEYCASLGWQTICQQRNEMSFHATAWMNFENIKPDQRAQSQKATCYMSLLP